MAKRYYWIQLKDGFFKQKEIKKLRKIAGGDTYTIIYLKMLLAAVKQENKLYFEGVEDSFPEELALELDEEPENVKVTLSFLERQGLIKLVNEDEFLLLQCAEMVGSESDSAERVRRHRANKMLQANNGVTARLQGCNTIVNADIEKEKDIDIKKHMCAENGIKPQASPEKNADEAVNGTDKPKAKDVEPYSNSFEEFWKVYPRKVGKAETYKKYKARLNDGFMERDLLNAAKGYADQCQRERTDEKYIKHGKTFLSENTPFIDYLVNPEPGVIQEPAVGNAGSNPFAKYKEGDE